MATTVGSSGAPEQTKLLLQDMLSKHHERVFNVALDKDEQQYHQAYLYLVMALVREFWNGNRRGVTGTYFYRETQKNPAGFWSSGLQYLGHNIAAIAVDGDGDVIDFDFNHNEIFKSSMEHAEARLLRRLFSLTGLRADWSQALGEDYYSKDPRPDDPQSLSERKERFSTTLSKVTIYTSLEPCAQCAGMMALARIPKVVYLQEDPGAERVADILHILKPYGYAAEPIPASACGLKYGTNLDRAYGEYRRLMSDPKADPFYVSADGRIDRSTNLTAFLCTDPAKREYDDAANAFLESSTSTGLRDFFEYAKEGGHRGTPH